MLAEGLLQTVLTLIICSGVLALLFNHEKFFKKKKTEAAHAEIAAAIGAVKAHTDSH
jgi:hypothetical protein